MTDQDFVTVGHILIERGVEGWRWAREDMDPVTALGYVHAVMAELEDDVKADREIEEGQ